MHAQTTATEWDAESYQRLSEPQFVTAMQLLQQLDLHGTETVVDAGCGSGRVTSKLLERLPHGKVICVDLSDNMLAMARRLVRPTASQSADFVRANLQEFCMPRAAHGVFSSMAVHFVPDKSRLVRNLAHTLLPGGWLAIQCGGRYDQTQPWHARLHALVAQPLYAAHIKEWNDMYYGAEVGPMRDALRAAGFVNVEVQQLTSAYAPAQRAMLREFLQGMFLSQLLPMLPAELHERMTADVHEATEGVLSDQIEYVVCRANLPTY